MLQVWIRIALTLIILIATTPFLGKNIARVFLGDKTLLNSVLNPLERITFVVSGVRYEDEMTGLQYAKAVLYSNLVMGILVFLILMTQGFLPLNPTELKPPTWDLVLHATLSFLTNADQQHYSGEITFIYASQTFALGFLMFTSAATGLAVGIAFIRGLTGRRLGNFSGDLTKSITRILLPMSIVRGSLLMMTGVPETLAGGATQAIARELVAHYEIIKQIGENGGGFFGVNSAHPFKNPNGFSNLLETWVMITIPSALIYTYGVFANNVKQAWLVFWMVFIIFVLLVVIRVIGEYQGNPLVNSLLGSQ
jgi:K+-transporting ATPase ATPase A chain